MGALYLRLATSLPKISCSQARRSFEKSMTISREDVLRVAELAQLELTPEEAELYRGQLDEILNYIGKLQKLDVTNVEPMTQMSFGSAEPVASSGASSGGPDSDLREDKLR